MRTKEKAQSQCDVSGKGEQKKKTQSPTQSEFHYRAL
jgi:hypothetical protein